MLKISDILKKAKGRDKGGGVPGEKQKISREVKPVSSDNTTVEKKHKKISEPVSPAAKAVKDKDILNPGRQLDPKISAAYIKAVETAKKLMHEFAVDGENIIAEIRKTVEDFIEYLRKDENSLMRLFFNDYSSEKGYLYQHAVNVCLLSLKLGIVLEYDYERLKKLGLAAFLHDVGMIRFEDIVSRPKRFDQNELNEVRKHPIAGQEILKQISADLPVEVFDVIRQEHERIDGSGYPYGLQRNDISEFARLIGLADRYEAAHHSRPYREKKGCMETLKMLLEDKNIFENKLLKILINEVGVFPIGNFVELNTKEIAVVLSQNSKMPLRPVLEVTHNSEGQRLENPKQADLAQNFSIFIKDCCELPRSNS